MGWLTDRRRRHLEAQPFPQAWRGHLEARVAAYALLDAGERARLHQLVQVFVAEKHWEGCGGLVLDDEVRVTIAGLACLMILGRDHDLFARVSTILVYPAAVVRPPTTVGPDVYVEPVREGVPLAGESVYGGAVILSWDAVVRSARDPADGRNVVFHELAHKIDELGGIVDGAPPLPDTPTRRAWAEAFGEAFAAHRERTRRGEPSLLDDYATRNAPEYFAVATEVFFERPAELARELPAIYALMRDFYNLDLAARAPDQRSPT